MKVILFLMAFVFIACQKQETTQSTKSTVASTSQQKSADDILADKDEACETSEMTEEKLVEQAMKPAKANEGGALQGATDCTVE